MGEKIGIEAEGHGCDDGGEGAGETPGPPCDCDAEDEGKQEHSSAGGVKERIGWVVGCLIESLDGVVQRGGGNGFQHHVPEAAVRVHFQRGFVCPSGDVEFPEGRVFGVDAEIVVVGLDPGS